VVFRSRNGTLQNVVVREGVIRREGDEWISYQRYFGVKSLKSYTTGKTIIAIHDTFVRLSLR
jgi:hypothetical protein